MGISERKEREKQEMRRKIIEAAMHMFLNEGYEKTSIRNIAERIEYSPATLYLYYKDKDELLYDVQKEAFDKLYEAFVISATAEDPFERLGQICRTYVRFGLENPELYDLMFIIRAPMNVVHDEEKWSNGSPCFNVFVQCLVDCIEKGCIRYDDVQTATLSVWSMGHGLISLDIRCRFKVMQMQGECSVSQLIDTSIDKFLELIKK